MAAMTALKILAAYFNNGEGKRPLREFGAELKMLSDDEKHDMATDVLLLDDDTKTRHGAASLIGASLI